MTVGFIGLGVMGKPMALNLVRAGTPLVVWNRTREKTAALRAAGASVAENAEDVFAQARVVMLMVGGERAVDRVLARGGERFGANVAGRVVVNMATTPPRHSRRLEADIRAHGGSYVEAPVSGSRTPAENGELVALVAGDAAAVAEVRPLLEPLARETFVCGDVPNALLTKLALNLFLDTMVCCLAESLQLAERCGLDAARFAHVLDASPMASSVSRAKAAKLTARDFSVQASVANVLENTRLIGAVARSAGAASPLLDAAAALYAETVALGHGEDDMAAVVRALEARGGGR